MQINLNALRVRPVSKGEETRYRELMRQHHYLGDLAKIGHTLWYVATRRGMGGIAQFFFCRMEVWCP